jgi:hypothetical protein
MDAAEAEATKYDFDADQAFLNALTISGDHNWTLVIVDREGGLTAQAIDGNTVFTTHFGVPTCGDDGKRTRIAARITSTLIPVHSYQAVFNQLRRQPFGSFDWSNGDIPARP